MSNAIGFSRASQSIPGENIAASISAVTEFVNTNRQVIRGGLPPRVLRRVREYVEAHLKDTISLDALAGVAGLSKYHFARVFKHSEGVTPHDYVVQSRVRHALELMSSTELSLSEIALAAGFSDQSHFTHRFRELVGVPPSSYRWSMR